MLQRPRLLGLLCAAFAVMAGLAYLLLAGAPSRLLLVNLLAFALGAALWVALGPHGELPTARRRLRRAGAGRAPAADGSLRGGGERSLALGQLGPISLQTSLVCCRR
jgi:hypothetical protein